MYHITQSMSSPLRLPVASASLSVPVSSVRETRTVTAAPTLEIPAGWTPTLPPALLPVFDASKPPPPLPVASSAPYCYATKGSTISIEAESSKTSGELNIGRTCPICVHHELKVEIFNRELRRLECQKDVESYFLAKKTEEFNNSILLLKSAVSADVFQMLNSYIESSQTTLENAAKPMLALNSVSISHPKLSPRNTIEAEKNESVFSKYLEKTKQTFLKTGRTPPIVLGSRAIHGITKTSAIGALPSRYITSSQKACARNVPASSNAQHRMLLGHTAQRFKNAPHLSLVRHVSLPLNVAHPQTVEQPQDEINLQNMAETHKYITQPQYVTYQQSVKQGQGETSWITAATDLPRGTAVPPPHRHYRTITQPSMQHPVRPAPPSLSHATIKPPRR